MTHGAIITDDKSAPVVNRPFRNVLPILFFLCHSTTDRRGQNASVAPIQGFVQEEISGSMSQHQNEYCQPRASGAPCPSHFCLRGVTCPPHSTGSLLAGWRSHMVDEAERQPASS